jgi:hypothetical protein
MCDIDTSISAATVKKYRLAEYFESNWEAYISNPHVFVTSEQFKAVNSIMVCRTAVLGVDEYVCTGCGEVIEIYHNCRNRFCPTCSWNDTRVWAAKIKEQLMNIPHRHVVFTLPHGFHPLAKSNGKELLNILLRTASDTLKDWAEHKHQIKIGIISVLHTAGETKDYHLHVHMIVSWGGISNETKELITIKGNYVNYKFLQEKFRIKFEDELVSLYDNGRLEHKFKDRSELLIFLRRINMKNWHIHLEPPMPTAEAVIRYIGRYSKRACISENKITEIAEEYISFRHKDYKTIGLDNKPVERVLKLHYKDFFPRLLQHVPFKNFRLVRYYGLYSNKGSIPEEYITKEAEADEEQYEWENPFVCNICEKKREYIQTTFDMRLPQERKGKFDVSIHPSYIYKRA